MAKIDVANAPVRMGTRYPAEHAGPCKERHLRSLGDPAGLTQFGVNLVRLPPGTWSSQRHWHSAEDEFVYLLEGKAVLITDEGEEEMGPGDCAGFKAGEKNGHCLQNRSGSDAVFLVVGSRKDDDHGEYSDIDLAFSAGRYSGKGGFTRKDGTPL